MSLKDEKLINTTIKYSNRRSTIDMSDSIHAEDVRTIPGSSNEDMDLRDVELVMSEILANMDAKSTIYPQHGVMP